MEVLYFLLVFTSKGGVMPKIVRVLLSLCALILVCLTYVTWTILSQIKEESFPTEVRAARSVFIESLERAQGQIVLARNSCFPTKDKMCNENVLILASSIQKLGATALETQNQIHLAHATGKITDFQRGYLNNWIVVLISKI